MVLSGATQMKLLNELEEYKSHLSRIGFDDRAALVERAIEFIRAASIGNFDQTDAQILAKRLYDIYGILATQDKWIEAADVKEAANILLEWSSK